MPQFSVAVFADFEKYSTTEPLSVRPNLPNFHFVLYETAVYTQTFFVKKKPLEL